jgi:guanosine-3',5'-bis(diphosphate) 3'-pyrophosphohydrolase
MTDPSSTALVVDAIEFAAHEHRGQRRKDAEATPYINHPIALVRILVCEAGIDDPHVLAAAALHDFLEDCCGRKQERIEEGRATLLRRFGERVLEYVNAVTDDKTLAKDVRKRLQIEHAASAPHGAKLVKLADKIANLRDIAIRPPADWLLEQRQDYYDWSTKVVNQLRGTHPLLEKLFESELGRRPDTAGLTP